MEKNAKLLSKLISLESLLFSYRKDDITTECEKKETRKLNLYRWHCLEQKACKDIRFYSSCLWGPSISSLPRHQLSWLRFYVLFLIHPAKELNLNGHGIFQFSMNSYSPTWHWITYASKKEQLNKLRGIQEAEATHMIIFL